MEDKTEGHSCDVIAAPQDFDFWDVIRGISVVVLYQSDSWSEMDAERHRNAPVAQW